MKVAFLIVALEPGGAPTYIIRLAEQYAERGIEVNILSLLCFDTTRMMMQDTNIPWQCLRMRNPYDLTVLFSIVSTLKGMRPQIVHTNHPLDAMLGNMAAQIVGIPSVTTFHGTLDHYYLPKTTAWSRIISYQRHLWAERIAGKLASAAIANSKVVKDELVEKRICPASKVTIIHHGLDLAVFDPGQFPATRTDRLTIGCICRIAPEKGIEYFIDAAILICRKYPQTRFQLVGQAKSEFEQQYLDHHLARLAGQQPEPDLSLLGHRTDIPFLISQMDIVIVPSLSEGFGLVVIEAMAMQTPVVASNVGGIPESLIDGESGLLVAPGNAEALAQAVERLIENDTLRERMGRQARRQAEASFGLDRMVEQTLSCYEAILD